MNNDLISREALKKAIDELFFVDEYTVEKAIENAPTVEIGEDGIDIEKYSDRLYKIAYEKGKAEAERPQGEWVVVGRAAYGYVDIECPCCKHLRSDIQADNKPNFCENCGADMRKPQTQKFADTDTAYGGLASAT